MYVAYLITGTLTPTDWRAWEALDPATFNRKCALGLEGNMLAGIFFLRYKNAENEVALQFQTLQDLTPKCNTSTKFLLNFEDLGEFFIKDVRTITLEESFELRSLSPEL